MISFDAVDIALIRLGGEMNKTIYESLLSEVTQIAELILHIQADQMKILNALRRMQTLLCDENAKNPQTPPYTQ